MARQVWRIRNSSGNQVGPDHANPTDAARWLYKDAVEWADSWGEDALGFVQNPRHVANNLTLSMETVEEKEEFGIDVRWVQAMEGIMFRGINPWSPVAASRRPFAIIVGTPNGEERFVAGSWEEAYEEKERIRAEMRSYGHLLDFRIVKLA